MGYLRLWSLFGLGLGLVFFTPLGAQETSYPELNQEKSEELFGEELSTPQASVDWSSLGWLPLGVLAAEDNCGLNETTDTAIPAPNSIIELTDPNARNIDASMLALQIKEFGSGLLVDSMRQAGTGMFLFAYRLTDMRNNWQAVSHPIDTISCALSGTLHATGGMTWQGLKNGEARRFGNGIGNTLLVLVNVSQMGEAAFGAATSVQGRLAVIGKNLAGHLDDLSGAVLGNAMDIAGPGQLAFRPAFAWAVPVEAVNAMAKGAVATTTTAAMGNVLMMTGTKSGVPQFADNASLSKSEIIAKDIAQGGLFPYRPLRGLWRPKKPKERFNVGKPGSGESKIFYAELEGAPARVRDEVFVDVSTPLDLRDGTRVVAKMEITHMFFKPGLMQRCGAIRVALYGEEGFIVRYPNRWLAIADWRRGSKTLMADLETQIGSRPFEEVALKSTHNLVVKHLLTSPRVAAELYYGPILLDIQNVLRFALPF